MAGLGIGRDPGSACSCDHRSRVLAASALTDAPNSRRSLGQLIHSWRSGDPSIRLVIILVATLAVAACATVRAPVTHAKTAHHESAAEQLNWVGQGAKPNY